MTTVGACEASERRSSGVVEPLQLTKPPWGAGLQAMTNFDALCSAHVEQLKVRYPDARHAQYFGAVGSTQLQSKVYFANDAVVFTSVFARDGTIRHSAELCMSQKKPVVAGFCTN